MFDLDLDQTCFCGEPLADPNPEPGQRCQACNDEEAAEGTYCLTCEADGRECVGCREATVEVRS